MTESDDISLPGPAQSSDTSTIRLVIRAEIIRDDAAPQAPRSSRSPSSLRLWVLALAVGIVVLLLVWLGFASFRRDTPATPSPREVAPIEEPRAARVEAASEQPVQPPDVVSVAPPKPSIGTLEPDGLPRALHEVVPNASQSALQTIRGTVRVSIQVTIDKHGKVVKVTAVDPGPSRYFERVSLAAAQEWTFATAAIEERTALVRFSFTRDGPSARLETAN